MRQPELAADKHSVYICAIANAAEKAMCDWNGGNERPKLSYGWIHPPKLPSLYPKVTAQTLGTREASLSGGAFFSTNHCESFVGEYCHFADP